MALPDELLEEIFRWLVRVAPPTLVHDCSRTRRGWLAALWVCQRWRVLIMRDRQCWALSYTHIPKRMNVTLNQARDLALVYTLTPFAPHFSNPGIQNTYEDFRRIDQIRRHASFEQCGSIILDGRGDVLENLTQLIRVSNTARLRKLDELFVRVPFTTDLKVVHLCRYDRKHHFCLQVLIIVRKFVEGRNVPSLNAPALTRIKLHDCLFPFQSRALTDMSIVFTDLKLDRLSPQRFVEHFLLPNSATLTNLSIVDALDDCRAPAHSVDDVVVTLPRLQHVTLRGTPYAIVLLLAAIRYPTTTTLDITLGGVHNEKLVTGATDVAGSLRNIVILLPKHS